jgi:pyridoxine 4-dehydrogenase
VKPSIEKHLLYNTHHHALSFDLHYTRTKSIIMSTFKIAGKMVNLGYGMGSLITPHVQKTDEEAIPILKAALENGANFWNAGLNYGTPERNTLHLLNAYFTQYPEDADKVVVSVKGCFNMRTFEFDTSASGVRDSIDLCLRILDDKCRIDLFQAARLNPAVPVEETISAIAEYVKAGKIGSVGISECNAKSLRRAAAVHPIAAAELELSLFSTHILEDGTAAACGELGIPIIAYGPLGKGFLSGQIRKLDDIPADDYRRAYGFPRFQPGAFEENFKLVAEVEKLANTTGVMTAQVALAWVASQSLTLKVPVIPLPGSASTERIKQNLSLPGLDADELKQLDQILERIRVQGNRVPDKFAHMLSQ